MFQQENKICRQNKKRAADNERFLGMKIGFASYGLTCLYPSNALRDSAHSAPFGKSRSTDYEIEGLVL